MAVLPLDHVASRVTVGRKKRRMEDCTGCFHGPGLEAVCMVVSMAFTHIPLAIAQSCGPKLIVQEAGEPVSPSAPKRRMKWGTDLLVRAISIRVLT